MVGLLVATSMLVACGRATGPERRHLAGVELAREALTLGRTEPKRKELLLRAKDELAAALAKTPRLGGANTTLAGVLVALDEHEAAQRLLTSDEDLPSDEVQARVGLRALLLAERQRWAEVVALVSDAPGEPASAAEVVAVARRYQAVWETPAPCPRALSGERSPDTTETKTEPTKAAEAPIVRITAVRDAWCRGQVDAPALLDALSGEAPALPRLALSHHRLRAAALSSLGRWADTLDALESAVVAASTLLASPPAEKPAESPGAPSPTQAMHPLLASLDLDRAVAHGWLGRVVEARRLVAGVLVSRDDPRAAALGRALNP